MTKAGLIKALTFAKSAISNTSNVPSTRVETYWEIFGTRQISDDQFMAAVKTVISTPTYFPKPKEIIDAHARTRPVKTAPLHDSGEFDKPRQPMPEGARKIFQAARAQAIEDATLGYYGGVSY